MIFSLDPITKNSELNLTKTDFLPVIFDPVSLALGDEFTYQFCDQISKLCGSLNVISKTGAIVIDSNEFCQLITKSDIIIQEVSANLLITRESPISRAENFFNTRNVVVQPDGIQGKMYKVGSYLQSAGSADLVANTIGLSKLAGVSGLQILKAQPIMVVAILMTGALFFYGCGTIVGNNLVGKVLITAGDALALPIKGVEIMWNSYANPVIQKVFGIPVTLNLTQTLKTGQYQATLLKKLFNTFRLTKNLL
jgi:hypothetical protein